MKEFDEKEILEGFVEELTESLNLWAKNATRLGLSISASNEIIPIDFIRIVKTINVRLDSFRKELIITYEFYKDMENQYGLKPLSVGYLNSYAIVIGNLVDALESVKEIADKYDKVIQSANEHEIDVNKYISSHNRDAIKRICELTVEKLLEMLNDNRLLGF